MKERELDSVLQVIENPVRRKIIKRLSQESGYALQLSKELGLGQPLVAKHLSLMEKAGLVTSALESSPSGPERRRYSLAKSISITMDVASISQSLDMREMVVRSILEALERDIFG